MIKFWTIVETPLWKWTIVDFEEHSNEEVNRYGIKLDKPTKWIEISYFFTKNICKIK